MPNTCTVGGCPKPQHTKGQMCSMHRARWTRHRDLRSRSERRVSENGVVILTKNAVAYVDPQDVSLVSKYCWYLTSGGYAATRAADNTFIYLHRLITNAPDHLVVDHADKNRLNNRRSNLRVCTPSENAWNLIPFKPVGYSRHKGVTLDKKRGQWLVQVTAHGVRRTGRYESEIEAATAYNKLAQEMHGEFAVLNDVR